VAKKASVASFKVLVIKNCRKIILLSPNFRPKMQKKIGLKTPIKNFGEKLIF